MKLKAMIGIVIIIMLVGCQNEPPLVTIDEPEIVGPVIMNLPNLEKISEDAMYLGELLYGINVDGETILYLKTKEAAEIVLEQLLASYPIEDGIELSRVFVEDVIITEEKVNVFDQTPFDYPENAIDMIIKGHNEGLVHIVESGENFWELAERYDISVVDLLDANPLINEKRLEIGLRLSIEKRKPYITIQTSSRVETVEPIPFERDENILTDKYYLGEYKVKQEGVPGEMKMDLELYLENGKVVGRKVISSEVLLDPIPQIVYQGTSKR